MVTPEEPSKRSDGGFHFVWRELSVLCLWAWGFVRRHVALFVGMGLCPWAWGFVRGHVALFVGMGLCSWAWGFVRGHVALSVCIGLCPSA